MQLRVWFHSDFEIHAAIKTDLDLVCSESWERVKSESIFELLNLFLDWRRFIVFIEFFYQSIRQSFFL